MSALTVPPWLAAFAREFTRAAQWTGLPLGAVVVGLAMGAALYVTVRALHRRPATDGAGTIPISVVPAWSESTTAPSGPPSPAPTPVRLFDGQHERSVVLRGAGQSPAAPIPRARGFVVAFVVGFAAASSLLLFFYAALFVHYDQLVGFVGEGLYWPLAWPGVYTVSISTLIVPDFIFPMYLAAMVAFGCASGLFTNHPPLPRHRRLLAIGVVATYFAVELIVDSLFFTVPGASLRSMALLVRTFAGGFFMALLTFCALFLPKPQRIVPRFPRDRGAVRIFFAFGLVSVAVGTAAILATLALLRLEGLAIAFTIILLLPLVTLTVFSWLGRALYFRRLARAPPPPATVYHPSVSILMPAYNEERWIAEAIRHADRASAHYLGDVEIVVGNDGSTDRTVELAREAIRSLEHARGLVVDLPHGGKSNALNGALALATGEIVIRCDSDTFISEESGFAAIIPHFADPHVGAVQGAVHPRQKDGWTRKLRALEIAWNHYFLRPAAMGTRSAEVVDGLFSAFRRQDLVDAGGWVPWNGEDTEITMRMQRLGYEVRIELGAVAYEDVPENYNELRKQRVRWARGVLMANGQHYPSLLGPTPEFAGLGVLFWFLLMMRSGVRSLVYLFLALLVVILGVPALLDVAVLLAIAIAIRAAPLAYFLLRIQRRDALWWIPFFPIANVLKQTFRFEAFGLLGPRALQEYA